MKAVRVRNRGLTQTLPILILKVKSHPCEEEKLTCLKKLNKCWNGGFSFVDIKYFIAWLIRYELHPQNLDSIHEGENRSTRKIE